MLPSGANPGGGLMSSEQFTFKEFICETGREETYIANTSSVYVITQQIVCVLSTQPTHTHTHTHAYKLTKTDFTLTRPLHT